MLTHCATHCRLIVQLQDQILVRSNSLQLIATLTRNECAMSFGRFSYKENNKNNNSLTNYIVTSLSLIFFPFSTPIRLSRKMRNEFTAVELASHPQVVGGLHLQ